MSFYKRNHLKTVEISTIVLIFTSLPAASFAQTMTLQHNAAPASAPKVTATAPTQTDLKCSDFKRMPDGAWMPTRTVKIAGTTVEPGVMGFPPGAGFAGEPVGDELQAQCLPH